jgi:hypothetical protein
MNIQDPSLYAVTPREISTPFTYPWANVPRFLPPFQTHNLQPFSMYGMQPFYPMNQFGYPFASPQYANYGQQTFVPPMYYGYGTPFQAAPCTTVQGGAFGAPSFPAVQNWIPPVQNWPFQKFWY